MSSGVRPDVEAVLAGLKDFQRRTVDHVFERMYGDDDPTRRFLIADEVGLGKTLVARGIIARAVDALWDEPRRIDVVYICSNGDIARQNVRRLSVSPEDEFALASRITLLPTQIQALEERKLNFVSFTPRTSLDTRSAMGIAEERALLYWMLHEEWGLGNRAGPKNVLRGSSDKDRFRGRIRQFDREGIDEALTEAFHERLVEHDRAEEARGRPGLRERFEDVAHRFRRVRQYSRLPQHDREDRRDLVADLRAVLAASCVTALKPDLVILDEFQRFKHLLDPDPNDDAGKLAHELFTYSDGHAHARVLLLSATPYKMYTLAHEASEEDHYADFLSTLRFLLHDEERSREVEELLARYRRQLLRIGSAGLGGLTATKAEIEARLRRVIVRTERLAVSEKRDGMLKLVPADGLRLDPGDVRSYLRLQGIARALEDYDILEYWKSAPYLFNFMDEYVEKRALRAALDDPARELELREPIRAAASRGLLPWARVERYGKVDPANPRLRRLREEMVESGTWRMLWMPPSLPYYRLRRPFPPDGEWAPTKRLVFSSWAVVPKAAAALLSFDAECEMLRSHARNPVNTPEARERRARPLDFRRRGGKLASFPVLGLMYGSPTLAEEVDPLAIALDLAGEGVEAPSLSEVIDEARKRVRRLLFELPVGVKRGGPVDETWYWLAPMLLDLVRRPEPTAEWFRRPDAWSAITAGGEEAAHGDGSPAAAEHVEEARLLLSAAQSGGVELGRRPRDLDRVLALAAIAGPGTTSLRALGRVAGFSHLDETAFRAGAGRVASGLRALFNVPEAVSVIRGIDEREPYWLRVLEYCADGCLQAVLDEYAHVLIEAQGLIDRAPAEVADEVSGAIARALAIRPARLAVDEIGIGSDGRARLTKRAMRTRFASRFGVDESSDEGGEATRADTIRTGFNSPFWPFALISTSVGQEGLDFHLYCHAVVHWNLPSNPVDLEQREGRVHRFKGHAVRKNVARRYGLAALDDPSRDPWTALFDRARHDRPDDASDLVPYWIYAIDGGAKIERHVPALPMSRDLDRYERLRRSLAVYRMAFGQSRQDDLIAFLLERMPLEEAKTVAEELRIDLAPA